MEAKIRYREGKKLRVGQAKFGVRASGGKRKRVRLIKNGGRRKKVRDVLSLPPLAATEVWKE